MLGWRLLADRCGPTLDQGKQFMAQLLWVTVRSRRAEKKVRGTLRSRRWISSGVHGGSA
jgi:hypothetical protein